LSLQVLWPAVVERSSLDEPLPVVITCLTAFVGADGTVFFHRDIYGRD
jgi:murein L,D-transpeptidase YcbB/YkuD